MRFSAKHLLSYGQAIATFIAYAGESVQLAGVSDELLAAFVAAGRASKQRRKLGGLVRQVVLAWNPDAVHKPRHRVEALPATKRKTVRGYFESDYAGEAMVGVRETSIESTRLTLRALHKFAGRDIYLAEQSDKLASDFFRSLLDRGLSRATVNRYRRTWFAVWRYAFDRGLVKRLPRVKRLKEIHNPPDSWELSELRRLIDAALEFRKTDLYGEVRCNLWWNAIFRIAYYTGLRRGSLLSICRADLYLKTALLYVPGENMKNRQGQMFQLGADAIAAVENIWLPQRLLLFPSQHHTGTLSKHFAQIMVAAGLPPGRRKGLSKFHKLRRTVATQIAARAGCAAASSLLGHSSGYVTARYIDATKLPGHDVTAILPNLVAV